MTPNRISFRCHYPNGEYTQHRQELPLKDLKKWIESYKFTHPDVVSISVKIWFHEEEENA